MEQEKIDVSRATPVEDGAVVRPRRRGAPIWLQLILSLMVIAAGIAIWALFFPAANTMLANYGITLPLLNGAASSDQTAASAPASGRSFGQGQGQAGGGTPQGQQPQGQQAAQTQTQQGQGRPQGQQGGGQFAGRGGGGGFGANRTAVVVAAAATEATINNKLTAIGEGSAVQSVTVSSASGGTLMSIDVQPGDHVEAGAQLATLDTTTQQNDLAKAQLAAQNADTALARAKSLEKANSIAATQVDAAQLAADNARLEVAAAQQALEQRTIKTPVAGTVGLMQVTRGNLINAQTVVTTVEDSSQILVNFWVPERYSSQIKAGMPVAANSAALPGQTFTGTVSAIDNKIDPESRTLQVQAKIPNPDGVIKSGMSFSVEMTFPGQTFAAVDPLAVQWSNQGAYVWKMADGKVHKGMVEIVQRNSDGVLVKGDVQKGDQIVTQGVLQLSDGAAVRLLDETQTAAATGQGGGLQGKDQGVPGGGTGPGQAQGQGARSGPPAAAGQGTPPTQNAGG